MYHGFLVTLALNFYGEFYGIGQSKKKNSTQKLGGWCKSQKTYEEF